jgi:hypothetical protein
MLEFLCSQRRSKRHRLILVPGHRHRPTQANLFSQLPPSPEIIPPIFPIPRRHNGLPTQQQVVCPRNPAAPRDLRGAREMKTREGTSDAIGLIVAVALKPHTIWNLTWSLTVGHGERIYARRRAALSSSPDNTTGSVTRFRNTAKSASGDVRNAGVLSRPKGHWRITNAQCRMENFNLFFD